MIDSTSNNKVKYLSKLSLKKYRDINFEFIVEGEHLVEEARKCGLLVEVYSTNNYRDSILVSYDVMKKITSLDNPPQVIGLCKKISSNTNFGDKILVLDEVQDPGNLGTIIRSALAFGVSSIILSEGCVDLYNPKVVRATQGMIFHINIYRVNGVDELIDILSNYNNIYTTNVNCGEDVRGVNSSNYVLIVGNEGNGVRDIISDMATSSLYINMSDKVESLNVGVACSILLYELGK